MSCIPNIELSSLRLQINAVTYPLDGFISSLNIQVSAIQFTGQRYFSLEANPSTALFFFFWKIIYGLIFNTCLPPTTFQYSSTESLVLHFVSLCLIQTLLILACSTFLYMPLSMDVI